MRQSSIVLAAAFFCCGFGQAAQAVDASGQGADVRRSVDDPFLKGLRERMERDRAARKVWRETLERDLSAAAASYDGCLRRASAPETRACVARYLADVDSVLADAYKTSEQEAASASDQLKQANAVAQTAWAKYRDAQCGAVRTLYGYATGSGVFAERGCRIKLAINRIRELAPLPGE